MTNGEVNKTHVVQADRIGWDLNGLRVAAEAVARGRIVAFPTETVYGLGGNALDEDAIREIYRVKGRPEDNPLIVHVAHPSQVPDIASSVPPMATHLIERFMPGPITLVLPRSENVPAIVSAGLDTVAVRCPSHMVAQAFISMAGVPVAAPSANLSGKPSPTRAAHVLQDFDGRIPFVIDGGACTVGLESTVVDVTGAVPVILRPGAVTARQIAEACGIRPRKAGSSPSGEVRSPGVKYRHYAPRAKVLVGGGQSTTARIGRTRELIQAQVEAGRKVGVFASAAVVDPLAGQAEGTHVGGQIVSMRSFGHSSDGNGAAKQLFDALRSLDGENVDVIVVQALPEEGVGTAFMNRVLKAAAEENA